MSLFTIIEAADTAGKLIKDKKLRSDLFNISVEGLSKIAKRFDTDGDGDIDNEDIDNLIEYSEMIASILGQAAIADGVVQEEEEDIAWEVLQEACFEEGGVFTKEILEISGLTKKQIKNNLIEVFEDPYSIKKIAKYAIKFEVEEQFYEMACKVVGADEDITEDEKDFLDELGDMFELSRFDIKQIKRKCLN